MTLRKLFRRVFYHPVALSDSGESDSDSAPSIVADQSVPLEQPGDLYASDAPLVDHRKDRFKRWPFAQRIAQTILARRDPGSLVVGIYGEWGEGKTTVLNFIHEELRDQEGTILVWFNPWRYRDDETMLRTFFATLADALSRKLTTNREKAGKLLERYGGLAPRVQLPGDAQLDLSASARALGSILSSVELEDLKRRLEGMLEEEGKQVVVLIDDIDRLDRVEIQTLFKIVKLTASFQHTIYVLAFDPNVVAQSIGEQYGKGDPDSGRNFLEKIVQVPLHLPAVDQLALRQICYESVNQTLATSGVEITEEQAQIFASIFEDTIDIRLRTPRMARRYGNALSFAMPIMKGEVNPVDQLFVEGMRVFYPALYDAVRDNAGIFLGTVIDEAVNKPEAKALGRRIIDDALEDFSERERKAAKKLLSFLFPRTAMYSSDDGYGPEWLASAAEEKRVASDHYFPRYFSYAVLDDDVSDQEIDRITAMARTATPEEIVETIRHIVNSRNVARFVAKLRMREDSLATVESATLALALALCGDLFPLNQWAYTFTRVAESAGMLIAHLVRRQSSDEARLHLATQIIESATPIGFAVECYRWIRVDASGDPSRGYLGSGISPEQLEDLGRQLARRIAAEVVSQPPHLSTPGYAPSLYTLWAKRGSREETNAYLTKRFADHPMEAVEFVRCYLGTTYSGRSSRPSEFTRDQYEWVRLAVDPSVISAAIDRAFFTAARSGEPHAIMDVASLDAQIARQFQEVHRTAQTQPATPPTTEYDDADQIGEE